MSSEHDSQKHRLDRVTEQHHTKDSVPENAQINSTDDNRRHALAEKQQALKAFRITGVDVNTGLRQEPFRLVDGGAVHHDVRHSKGTERIYAAQLNVAGTAEESPPRLGTLRLPGGIEWAPPTIDFDLSKFKIDTSFVTAVKEKFHKVEDGLRPDKQLLGWKKGDAVREQARQATNTELVDYCWSMVDMRKDPRFHVAIVTHDKDGKLVLIQKPDDIHHVQKCSWDNFRNHFRKAVPNLDIPGPDIDVYRR